MNPTRRSFLSSMMSLAGAGGIATILPGGTRTKPFSFETLPDDCFGVRVAMSVDAFNKMVSKVELKSKRSGGWAMFEPIETEADGTQWRLLCILRRSHACYRTKEDAIEGCVHPELGKRIPSFLTNGGPAGTWAGINPEWRDAKWMVVTILRVPKNPPPMKFKFEGAHWINTENV